ncbi:carboxylate-amine ligase [Aeromicrobium ginsengisoli]|uniref:Putative glutamate--cysteine ligase 2 n=1 Tax=Aeromicrobium ginsengisoli TaxID=363867 RepID=A0A5M4FE10_9ACTN|nr:glutamate--cysteine ligase [Aeromicrobium ginsengisoli]KAA1397406.1 YbdK family carboxylate-amine ligase [Aeromicrobium ginsengisoli]
MTVREVGVEEEMFLIDARTRQLVPVSDAAVHSTRAAEDDLDQELFLQQLEIRTRPHTDPAALRFDLVEERRLAAESAEAVGAALAAVATPILPHEDGRTTPKHRYVTMLETSGKVLGQAGLVCGTHVHVSVDEAEAVRIIDDIQPWLPLVSALSSNSPFYRGEDTGYASWRRQLYDGWPSAGPVEPFVDVGGYQQVARELIASGAALDEGMLYFDARLSRNFPTIEIRVADACTDLDDTVLIAEVARALVETAARARQRGDIAPPWRVDLLRGARWRSRRNGLTESLMDPVSRAVVPADQALGVLLDHLRPVLEEHGSEVLVDDGIRRLLADGTGSERQRAVAAQSGDLTAVVDDVIRRTRAPFDA